MGNICLSFMQTNDKTRKTRNLSINVLYNKQKVLKIKQLALKKKKWTVEDIGKVIEKTELELEKRGMKTTKAKKSQRKLFRQKARLLINYLTVVQQRSTTNVSQLKKRKTFKDSVRHLINVMKMTTANRVDPGSAEQSEDVEVVLASKLAHFMDKWKDEERVLFETEEEAVIVQKILEEVLGHELGYELKKGDYMFNNFSCAKLDSPPLPGAYDVNEDVNEHNAIVHTSNDNQGSPSPSGSERWSVKRRSSARPRLARTNSVFPNEEGEESDVDSCFSESSFSETDSELSESEFPLMRRHSAPSLHTMANLDLVKFVVSKSDGKKDEGRRDLPTIVVTVPDEDENRSKDNSNGWETGGYPHYTFSLKDDIDNKEEKLQRMYERPLSASAGMLNTKGRKSKKTTLDRVNRNRVKQKRKAKKMKRRRDSQRQRL